MKNLRTAAIIAVALIASACATKENTNTNTTTTPPPSNGFNRTYSIQGYVADATTGARIGGGDLQLFLVMGTEVRTPSRLNSGASDPLLGEFAFGNIPLDLVGGNKTYKVVAVKPGYQRFETEIAHTALTTLLADPANAFDTVYNYIGNIYLFPVGATAPQVQFEVRYNGFPVPNATVLLDPVPEDNVATANTGHALGAASMFLASLSGTTDANGQVTFPGANLVLGGVYTVQVLPVMFQQSATATPVQLARYVGTTNYTVGVSNAFQGIVVEDLIYSDLYVTDMSTLEEGRVDVTGTLTITFNRPVAIVTGSEGWDAQILGSTTATLNTPRGANHSLSADGRTLTLTPNWATQLAGSDSGVTITYNDNTAYVVALDYPAIRHNVFALYRPGDLQPISARATVTVVAPTP